jgi:hypothetical protein
VSNAAAFSCTSITSPSSSPFNAYQTLSEFTSGYIKAGYALDVSPFEGNIGARESSRVKLHGSSSSTSSFTTAESLSVMTVSLDANNDCLVFCRFRI